jgi:hypothetical protein
MPKIWERAVQHIKAESSGVNPYAAATASLQKAGEMKPGTRELTKKGEKRQAKGPKWRHAHPPATGGAVKPSLGRAGRHW